EFSFFEPVSYLIPAGTVKDRRSKVVSQFQSGPAKSGLIQLTEIHTGRHTQRVQYDINWRTVRKERHILYRHDLGNNTLVTVATGHLVTHLTLTLTGNIDFGHLLDTRLELITLDNLVLFDSVIVNCQINHATVVAVALLDQFVFPLVIDPLLIRIQRSQ